MLGKSSRKSRVRCSRRVKAEPTKPRGVGMSRRVDPEQELLKALREQESTAAEALVTAYGDRAYRLAVISTRVEETVAVFVRPARSILGSQPLDARRRRRVSEGRREASEPTFDT